MHFNPVSPRCVLGGGWEHITRHPLLGPTLQVCNPQEKALRLLWAAQSSEDGSGRAHRPRCDLSACTDSSIATWGQHRDPGKSTGMGLSAQHSAGGPSAQRVLVPSPSSPIFVWFAYLGFALWGSLGQEPAGWLRSHQWQVEFLFSGLCSERPLIHQSHAVFVTCTDIPEVKGLDFYCLSREPPTTCSSCGRRRELSSAGHFPPSSL